MLEWLSSLTQPFGAVFRKEGFPFSHIYLASHEPSHHEQELLGDFTLCLFKVDGITFFVQRGVDNCKWHAISKWLVEHGIVPLLGTRAHCAVRVDQRMSSIKEAYDLLHTCGIKEVKVLQYGQKAAFSDKFAHWVLANVCVHCCLLLFTLMAGQARIDTQDRQRCKPLVQQQ